MDLLIGVLFAHLIGPFQDKTERLPIPEAAAQKEAEKTVKDLFKADYAKKGPADRQALARSLLQAGERSQSDPSSQWVLFREAQDLASQAGDVETASRAAERAGQVFEIPAFAHRLAALTAVGKSVRTPEETTRLVEHLLALAEASVVGDDFDTAEKAAAASARRVPDATLAARAAAFSKEVGEHRARREKARKAEEAIAKNTNDPAAALDLGQYLCFVRGAWSEGLPMLVKGSDAALKAVAERDLLGPPNAAEQTAVGDGWFDLAEKEKGWRREKFYDRAQYWYETAFAVAPGLVQAKIEKRLATMPGSRRPMDLLGRVDPAKDAIFGSWSAKDGALASDNSEFARIEFPYRPPAEYDMRIGFNRLEGNGDIVFFLSQGGRPFAWVWTDGGNNCSGFASVKGMWNKSENPSRVSAPGAVVNGRAQVCVIEVRRDRLRVSLDGKTLKEWKTNYETVELPEFLKLRDGAAPGFGTYKSPTLVLRAELIEVTGRGRRIR